MEYVKWWIYIWISLPDFLINGLIVVEQTFVGEQVILAEGEFSIQQEPRNTGGTYARFPN